MKKQNPPLMASLLALSLFATLTAHAKQLLNPVARCADCVMMKHRGTYYMTGTGAAVEMLVSKNLTDWDEPIPFFQTPLNWTDKKSMLDMHAPSLKYHNGTFYFYWNGIACATADKVLGLSTEDGAAAFNGITCFEIP